MTIAGKKLFVSVLTYDLHRRLGAAAAGEFLQQVQSPSRLSLPCARTVARLATLAELTLYHGASSCLPKARSRAAFEAWKSGADFWVMCDDDVEASTATIADLIGIAGRPSEARIAVLPYVQRGTAPGAPPAHCCVFSGEARLNVEAAAWVRPLRRGGCGLMVVTRRALEQLHDAFALNLSFVDDDGAQRVALFDMLIDGLEWLGEDFSFCHRAESVGVELVALVQGISNHAGVGLELESLR